MLQNNIDIQMVDAILGEIPECVRKDGVGIKLALSGPQGAGKTTIARHLSGLPDIRIAVLSLDDFYLPRSDRKELAKHVSPLMRVRGPAGTHDLQLLQEVLDQITSNEGDRVIRIPAFSKRLDDRMPFDEWNAWEGKADLVLVEGWLMGAKVPEDFLTKPPMNLIENKPGAKRWLEYQAEQLQGPYYTFFEQMDHFIYLSVPSFKTILDWRTEQEAHTLGMKPETLPPDRRAWVEEFIMYYERLTTSMIEGSRFNGTVINLNEDRSVGSVEYHNR